MRQSVFPQSIQYAEGNVFLKEKQTLLAISPPLLRRLTGRPNCASLLRRDSKPPG